MENWKIPVLIALPCLLIGYSVYSQKQENVASTLPSATPAATKSSPWLHKSPPAWHIPSPRQWVNTKLPVTLDSLRGNVALVEIFRINCPHCQDAAPFMEALYLRYSKRGLKMATLQSPGDFKDPTNSETDWNQVKSWVKERSLTYPVGFDKDSQYFQGVFHGTLYPTVFILTPEGKVSWISTGHDAQKALALAVALEKALPGPGTTAQRAQDLAKWLARFPDFAGAPSRLVSTIEGGLKAPAKTEAPAKPAATVTPPKPVPARAP
jgi:hypothetical protein